jgi:hypothetical protein
MKKVFLFLLLLLTTIGNSQSVTYTSDNTNFSNPERGWYKYSKANSIGTYSFLSQSSLTTMRTSENITQILRLYDLGAFITTPISQTFLNNIQTDFNTLRASGVKCILRFRYSETNNIDTTKDILLSHIEQLKTITIPNQDVISVIEAGFIGQYGEWYYTSNYGDKGVLTTQNIVDRKEIGLKIMELAPSRLIMFRTPYFQQMIGGTSPITPTNAYNGTTNSRIGLHNDAFLSSNSDSGTFKNTTTEYTYLDAQSNYTFCGGESNALFTSKQDCFIVFSWLTRFHYNYLNFAYHPDVISLWKTQGCYDEIQRRLGYRFELINSNITNNILTINLKNVGFANIYNQRDVYLILKNVADGKEYPYKLNTDIRKWDSSTTITISDDLLSHNIPFGFYELFLNLPDKTSNNIPYSIRFANTGVYDSLTGYNKLNQSVTIGTVSPPQPIVTVYVENNIIKVTNLFSYTIGVYNLSNRLVSTSNDLTKLRSSRWYIIKVTDTLTGMVYTLKYYKI